MLIKKLYIRKVRTSSVNSSSILFSCSIREVYNRVKFAKKQRRTSKAYIPGINSLIDPNWGYENIFMKK